MRNVNEEAKKHSIKEAEATTVPKTPDLTKPILVVIDPVKKPINKINIMAFFRLRYRFYLLFFGMRCGGA